MLVRFYAFSLIAIPIVLTVQADQIPLLLALICLLLLNYIIRNRK